MKNYDPHWTIHRILEEAKAGDPQAQFAVAEALWSGRRTIQELPEAVFWYGAVFWKGLCSYGTCPQSADRKFYEPPGF